MNIQAGLLQAGDRIAHGSIHGVITDTWTYPHSLDIMVNGTRYTIRKSVMVKVIR